MPAPHANEFPFVRGIHDALQGSVTADIARNQLAPAVLVALGALFSADVKSAFHR